MSKMRQSAEVTHSYTCLTNLQMQLKKSTVGAFENKSTCTFIAFLISGVWRSENITFSMCSSVFRESTEVELPYLRQLHVMFKLESFSCNSL